MASIISEARGQRRQVTPSRATVFITSALHQGPLLCEWESKEAERHTGDSNKQPGNRLSWVGPWRRGLAVGPAGHRKAALPAAPRVLRGAALN